MVMRTPAQRGILKGKKETVCKNICMNFIKWTSRVNIPVHGEKLEGYGTANDLLHIRADDCQFHHQPQNDPRHLKNKGNQ